MKAAYIRLFETAGKGIRLLHCDLKMLFSGFPMASGRGGDTRNRLRETEDRPERHRSSADQLTCKWVELASLGLLAEHSEALNYQREHPPRTPGVLLPATRKPRAVFIENRERAIAIACIRHLSKKRSNAESLDRAPSLDVVGDSGMQ